MNPGSGNFPGEGKGYPHQYFCLENPMDRGAWQGAAHGVSRVGQDLATKPPPPLHWELGVLTIEPPGKSHFSGFKMESPAVPLLGLHLKTWDVCSATQWCPGSSVHGVLQARILEWVPSSTGSSQLRWIFCTGRWVHHNWCHLGKQGNWNSNTYMYPQVHSSTTHKSQKAEAAQMPISG